MFMWGEEVRVCLPVSPWTDFEGAKTTEERYSRSDWTYCPLGPGARSAGGKLGEELHVKASDPSLCGANSPGVPKARGIVITRSATTPMYADLDYWYFIWCERIIGPKRNPEINIEQNLKSLWQFKHTKSTNLTSRRNKLRTHFIDSSGNLLDT